MQLFSGKNLTPFCAFVTAIGGFIYGYDTGIIATTIAHPSFALYMYGSLTGNASTVGAIVSVYYAGKGTGGIGTGPFLNWIGRKRTITLASFLGIFGGSLQAGSTNVGMLIAGRFFAGISTGALLAAVPCYISELAVPEKRGFLGNFQGTMVAVGFSVANWIGYAGGFAHGQAQWRIPLACQCPLPVLLCVLSLFIPYSPRWLVQKDRFDEAEKVLRQLHGHRGEEFVQREFIEIREQNLLERETRKHHSFVEMFTPRFLRRSLTVALILFGSQMMGASAIQNYQSLLYAALGFKGNTILLISGIYGLMGVIGQFICLFVVADKWPRVRTMYTGCISLTVILSILMAISKFYADGSNPNGSRAGIALIFIYSATYAVFINGMVYVLASELFPLHLRGYGTSLSILAMSCAQILLTQVTPFAFAAIEWKYYAIFIACNVAMALFYFLCLPETNGKSLEEIAEAFGDDVVRRDLHRAVGKLQEVEAAHVEDVPVENVPKQ